MPTRLLIVLLLLALTACSSGSPDQTEEKSGSTSEGRRDLPEALAQALDGRAVAPPRPLHERPVQRRHPLGAFKELRNQIAQNRIGQVHTVNFTAQHQVQNAATALHHILAGH